MKGTIVFDFRSGESFRIDSEYCELQDGYWCTYIETDEYGNITGEFTSVWRSRREIEQLI